MSDVLYFGCLGSLGHYLWESVGGRPMWVSRTDARYHLLHRLDGLLCPLDQTEGALLWHNIHGYTAIAFWDRSIDSRPGSSSTFYLKGSHGVEEVLAAARGTFPDVFARIKGKFALRLAEEKP